MEIKHKKTGVSTLVHPWESLYITSILLLSTMKPIKTIQDVIHALDAIIEESKKNSSPLGYFAALYRKVTKKVKEGVEKKGVFQDDKRMERLDVIFASRYIDAYYAYQKGESVTLSWVEAFNLSKETSPIVLQHLLIGMNAHINLDLGIAAAEVMKGKNIQDLEHDFNKINEILADLVGNVEKDLTEIWPMLKWILKWTKGFDTFLINFSMEEARKGAWKFAVLFHGTPESEQPAAIHTRDKKVAKIGDLVTTPPWIVRIIFKIVRRGERGTVAEKIQDMED